jgi:tetratricopeptide (TPR) repeat protein
MRSQHFISSILMMTLVVLGRNLPEAGQVIEMSTEKRSQTSELDRAIAEGFRLFKEGSAVSLRKVIGQFEKALGLDRSAKAQGEPLESLLFLGRLYADLDEKQKVLDYYNQALLLLRAVSDQCGEAVTLRHIGLVYAVLGDQ